MPVKLSISYIHTPLGRMKAAATDEGICLFDFEYRRIIDSITKRIVNGIAASEIVEAEHPHFHTLRSQVAEYFDGLRTTFDIPLHLVGTDFQKKVWNGLMEIPYGETRSYKRQSILLGNEKAIRAVAGANGENGIAIIIPCHRVIARTAASPAMAVDFLKRNGC